MSCREYVLWTAVVARVHINRVSFGGRPRRRHTSCARQRSARHHSLVLEHAPRPHRRGAAAIGMSLVQSLPRRQSRRMQCNFKLQSLPSENAQSAVVGIDRLNVDTIRSYG